jgi:autotransporter translocation and assembly factor TamB
VGSAEHQRPRSRKRRWIRLLGALLVGLSLLVVGALLALRSQRARSVVAAQVSAFLNTTLRGKFRLGAVERIAPFSAVVRDFEVRDRAGRLVLRAPRVQATLALGPLLHGDLVFETARVDGAWVSLHQQGEGLAIAEVFLPRVPSPPEPVDPNQPPWLFKVRDAQLHGAAAVELPGGLGATQLEARGELSYSDAFRLHLVEVRARLHHARGAHASLQAERVQLRLGANETSQLRARLGLGPDHVDLSLSARWSDGFSAAQAALRASLSPEGLRQSGMARAGAALRAEVALSASAAWAASEQRVGLHVELQSAGGALVLDLLRDRATGHATLRTPGLPLHEILDIPGLPFVRFGLELRSAREADAQRLELRAREVQIGSHTIPNLVARGTLNERGAHLTSLELPSWRAQRGKLDVDVAAEYSGNLRASVSASLPRLTRNSRLGQLSGARSEALSLRARAHYDIASDKLAADARVQVASLQLAGTSIGEVQATLQAHGSLTRPSLSGEAKARRLGLGGLHIDAAELSARGGPRSYTINAQVVAREARAELDLGLNLGPNEQRLSGSGQIRGWLPKPVQLALGELSLRPDQLRISGLRASAGRSVLAVEGSYGRTRASDLHVRLEQLAFHLPVGAATPDQPPPRGVQGHASAHLHFTGNLAEPTLDLSLSSPDLSFRERPVGALSLRAELATRAQRATAQLWLTHSEGDSVQLSLEGKLPATGTLPVRLDQAHYALTTRVEHDVSRLVQLLRGEMQEGLPTGKLELSAELAGPWRRPVGALSIVGSALALPRENPVDARLEVRAEEQRSQIELALTDAHGALASARAELEEDVLALADALQRQRIRDLRAHYSVHLAERRFSALPRALRSGLPITLALDLELDTAPALAPRARLSAAARYLEADARAGCPGRAAPRVALEAELADNQLSVELNGTVGDTPALHLTLAGPMPTLAELSRGQLERGLRLALDVKQLELGRLPGLCGRLAGTLRGGVRAEDLLSDRPKLAGQLRARGLRYGDEAEGLDLYVGVRADRGGLSLVTAQVQKGEQRVLRADAHLPWSLRGGRELTLDAAHCKVKAELESFPLAELAGALPWLAQPSGLLTGQIDLTNCADASGLSGELALRRAAFTVKDPLLRAEGLSAQLRLSPTGIELHQLELSDQGGILHGRGQLAIAHGQPQQGQFTFAAEAFPLRSDAKVGGYLDGKVEVDMQWSSVPHRLRVALDEITIRLPQHTPHDSQQLARHADIVYVDAPTSAQPGSEPAPSTPLELKLVADQPFWVRGNELSIQLKLNLVIESGADGAELRGKVDVVRGFLNLFSKGFDIERGELIFDGGERVDPTVAIDAVHKLGDGQTVTVHIRDRLSSPSVTFSTSVAGITSDAEILQLLVRGRQASAAQTAQAQVGAALAGMTSELLGSLANTKLGKYVPVLSLEAGASSGTRIRAGVEANSLIPAKLRSVVEGAYVEGFVGSRNQGGTATATGGVKMELYFPKDLVTGGTWELPNNWNVELTWEP